MNVLEKILEEIENESKLAHEEMRRCASENPLQFEEAKGYARGVEYVAEIIRSHMNEVDDGWIPVEERLPNKREFQEAYCRNHYAAEFLVTIEGATRPTTLYFKNNSWFDEERNYYKVIAWQPLPEAYHPKQAPAAEHIMSRFMKVE